MKNPFKKHFQKNRHRDPLEGTRLQDVFSPYELDQIKKGQDLRGNVTATDITLLQIRGQEFLHMGITGRKTHKRKTKKIAEGSLGWFDGYLYYSWKHVRIARRQMPKKPPVLRDWMFFESTNPQNRRFCTDRDIELLVPLEDLIKKGVVIG